MTPPDEFDTVKMAQQTQPKSNKAEMLKAWGVILGSFLAFATSITVAVLQQYSVSKSDLSKVKTATNDGMTAIAQHTNNVVIPKLQDTIVSLRERLATNETEIKNLKELLAETRREILHPEWKIIPDRIPGLSMIMSKPDTKPRKAHAAHDPTFVIPKLQVQQMAQ